MASHTRRRCTGYPLELKTRASPENESRAACGAAGRKLAPKRAGRRLLHPGAKDPQATRSSRAIYAIGRPEVRARRAGSSRNSRGYGGLLLGLVDSFLEALAFQCEGVHEIGEDQTSPSCVLVILDGDTMRVQILGCAGKP